MNFFTQRIVFMFKIRNFFCTFTDKGAGSAKLTGKSEVPAADEERSQNLATMSLILFDEVVIVWD